MNKIINEIDKTEKKIIGSSHMINIRFNVSAHPMFPPGIFLPQLGQLG